MDIRLIDPASPDYPAITELRDAVLRRPLGLSLHDEDLSFEKDEHLLAAYDADKLLGCVMLRPLPDGEMKLRQMAVFPEQQGRRIGTALVAAAETFAKTRGFKRMTLHARDYAIPFYENCAYLVDGEGFEEVGIPHHFMHKSL